MIVGKSVQDREMSTMEEQSSRPKIILSLEGMSQGKGGSSLPGGAWGPGQVLTQLGEGGTWEGAEQMKDGCLGSESWTFYWKAGPEKARSLGM